MKPASTACLAASGLALAAAAYSQQKPRTPDVVVEGKRAPPHLQGGDWRLGLSRAFTYGKAADPNETRPLGADRIWHVCLAPTDVEPLMRILVGEGQTSSATAHCGRLFVKLGGGKLLATQSCFGTTMRVPSEKGFERPLMAARNTLTVTGHYSPDALTLDFADVQEPAVPNPAAATLRTERHWSIKGQRQGDCPLGKAP